MTDRATRSRIHFLLCDASEFTGKARLEGGLRLGYNRGDARDGAVRFCRHRTDRIVVNGAIDFNHLEGFIDEPRTVAVRFRVNF